VKQRNHLHLSYRPTPRSTVL